MNISLNIGDRLYKQVKEYCEFNDIQALNEYMVSLIERGLLTDKYGDLNATLKPEKIEYEKAEYDEETETLTLQIKDYNEEIKMQVKKFLYIKAFETPKIEPNIKEIKEEPKTESIEIPVKKEEPKKVNKTRRKLQSK